jgi:hypothetical protein
VTQQPAEDTPTGVAKQKDSRIQPYGWGSCSHSGNNRILNGNTRSTIACRLYLFF